MGQGLWSKMSGAISSGEQEEGAAVDAAERKQGKPGENFRFAVYILSALEDGKRAADALKSGNGVVVNGENLDELTFQRALDFLDGPCAGHRQSQCVRQCSDLRAGRHGCA